MTEPLLTFWTMPAPQLLEQLGSGPQGLSSAQAAAALARHGPNTLRPPPRFGGLRLLLKQVQSPITLILIAAAILALACTGLAYLLYFRLIAHVGPTKAIAVTYLIPAFALAWGWLFLAEVPTPTMLVGGLVILAGTALATGVMKGPQRTDAA